MEHLWAPWRGEYIQQNGSKNHAQLFTEIGISSDDEENLVLQRSKACFTLLNRYPYNTGHLMVVPYRAVTDLEELSEQEMMDVWGCVRKMTSLLKNVFKPGGFNIGINLGKCAGAGIAEHMHIHIVPRWPEDNNFMTTTADTRIHPNDLKAVYEKLKSGLGSTSPRP